MNKRQLKQDIKKTMDSNTPDVLQQIKSSPRFAVPPKPSVWDYFKVRKRQVQLSFLGIFVVALFIMVGVSGWNDPVVASTVTLDINPSIVITLDDEDNVISVSGYNDDGDQVVQRNIRYRGLSIEEVIDILVIRLNNLGYIVTTDTDTNVILIEVDASDTMIRDRVETAFRNRLDEKMEQFGAPHWVLNARNIELTDQQRERLLADQRATMHTRAKLSLIYRITTLDPSYEIDDLIQQPIRDLYDLYISLEDPDNLPDYDRMPGHMPGPR